MSAGARERPVVFGASGDLEVPYVALVDGHRWAVRLNDFPAEPLYTLLVDGEVVEDLEEWPAAWVRPAG